MRRYHGFIADNSRWDAVTLRDDDVIVATPSKCGTTWMQTIVGMLIHGRTDLGQPMGLVAPWIDMTTRPRDEIGALLEAQGHRRFMKTHTPLDGVPWHDAVTYIVVVRHPLDAALSNRDHLANTALDRTFELREAATGWADLEGHDAPITPPEPADDYLRWWIADEQPPSGGGCNNLADFANSVQTYWALRERPNVHLFHYADLQADLDGQMRRVATVLRIPVPGNWDDFVEAATFDSMRARAEAVAPEAHLDFWKSTENFFRQGGRRNWSDLLTDTEVEAMEQRLADLVGDAAATWALG